MKSTTNTGSEGFSTDATYMIHGIIRGIYQQPMPGATVSAYNKTMRDKTLLGTAVTAADGSYTIAYNLKKPITATLIVGVYDGQGNPLKENEAIRDIPADLQADFDLSNRPLAGQPDFDRLMELITPFTEEVPLAQMTESAAGAELSFIAQKTGLSLGVIEQLAMAARFESLTSVAAYAWYSILRFANVAQAGLAAGTASDFEARVIQTLDSLMHKTVDELTGALQAGINNNTIAYHYLADMPALGKQLSDQIVAYAQKHPITGQPSILLQNIRIGGLKGADLLAFIDAKANHSGSEAAFWEKLERTTILSDPAKAGAVQATMQVAAMTGNNPQLTRAVVDTHKINTVADIKQLAGYTREEWADMLKKNNIVPDSTIPGNTDDDKLNNYAARLDASFTSAYPTAAFAARLQKDDTSKLPQRDKVSRFLQNNPGFDLLNHQVGTFIKENPNAVDQPDQADVAEHVRRVQRVMKLAPSYESASVLLNDGIHSAQQIHKMGENNFMKAYGDKLGQVQAAQVFKQASATHASALALTGNLKSMADASAIKAFPNFKAAIERLSADIPNLDTLFTHADACECDECNSVYGAPAYLTDILHFLDQRHSALDAVGDVIPTVKDVLLRRRPDLGDIDLNCDNTNTLVPYIDIACELMEDYISPPVITLANNLVPSLSPGIIAPALLTAIKAQFTTAGLTSVAALLTSAAKISDAYTTTPLLDDGTFAFRDNYIIRDARIALRASLIKGAATPTIEVRVLHQTFQDADTIAAGPEYVNTNVYSNFLAKAKRPFTLPFDLFETEGELYLQQLGISKANLIDIFRKEDHTAVGNSVSDLRMGYASLGINLAEQTLIFVADPTHFNFYWGGDGSNNPKSPTELFPSEVDVMLALTGLNYDELLSLISLQFINPTKDIAIQHDTLAPDINQQRLINLNEIKMDAMHRFIRLWRKTSFSMQDLDAIIMAPKMGGGAISTKLPYRIQLLTSLQQKLQLGVEEILAFYQDIDTTQDVPGSLYNQLFQNITITNPVNTRFSITTVREGTTIIVDSDKQVLAAILQLPLSDVNLLLTKTTGKISRANFSSLFRYTKLAQGLDLSITDLLTLTNLIDANPFLDPVSTTLFIDKYNALKSSGFSIDELNYILRHQDNTAQALVPTSGQIAAALTQVQTEFQAIVAATQPAPDQNGQLLTKWLSDGAFNWDRGLLSKLADILNTVDDDAYLQKLADNTNFLNNLRLVYHDAIITAGLPALPLDSTGKQIVIPDFIASQLSYDTDNKRLQLVGYMSTSDKAALLALVAGSTTDPNVALYTAAVNSIFTKAQQTDNSAANMFFSGSNTIATVLNTKINGDTASRFSYFINLVSPVYIKLQQQNALVKDIANWFAVDKKVVTQLLISIPGIYADFSAANFIGKSVPLTNAVQVNRYLSLAKICFIAAKLKLTDAELAFQVAHAADINSLDITALPLVPVTAPATTFPAFEAFINLLKFDQNYPAKVTNVATGATMSIYSILADAVAQKKANITGTALTTWIATLVTNLALLTGWNQADLSTLIGAGGNIATLSLPADIYSVPVLMRLNQRITMQQQLGITIADAFNWTKDALLAADTAKIKQAVKSKYANSDWVQVSKKAQDTLREKKRNALIAYLMTDIEGIFRSVNDIYAYFLIDVEMCSCQPTSRIVQATNSIQLFVQRCIMQLEPDVLVDTATDSVWKQWQWMKNFRVWQANKKVFLWPENYIEPELLPVDVKSSFFTDLENDLLQGEVTAENAEDAFGTYLHKVLEVARLEIKGTWYDDPSKTLYVIGRTHGGDPKTYYFRKFIEERRWTPWEKIPIGIDGDHILPVVYNSRLYLFWGVFKQRANPANTNTAQLPPQWVIQLAYSVYSNGKWSAKKISRNDNTGNIIVDSGKYPNLESFLLFGADLTKWDYTVNTTVSLQVFDKAWDATAVNGDLIINFSYFTGPKPPPAVGVPDESIFDNLGNFQIDINGSPVKINLPVNIDVVNSDITLVINGPTQMKLSSMSFVAISSIQQQTLPDITMLDKNRGAYQFVKSFQEDRISRFETLISITPAFKTPWATLSGYLPFFYQDSQHTYLVLSKFAGPDNSGNSQYQDLITKYTVAINENPRSTGGIAGFGLNDKKYQYINHYHPFIPSFLKTLFNDGIDGLMDRNTQLLGDVTYDNRTGQFDFASFYPDFVAGVLDTTLRSKFQYAPVVPGTAPREDVDFSPQAGYGLYNWELFYHVPLMIAERLSQNQQFDDADRWYRYIFNPLDTSDNAAPNKFWNTKPFFETTNDDYLAERIDQILQGVGSFQNTLINNVADWRNNPFQPHFIAQYRTVAYQKVAVMKYIGHLIRYGDHLFTQDTMESVNQATQLYILAAEILGPKPQELPSPVVKPIKNYSQLEQKLDSLSDAIVDVENLMPFQAITGYTGITPGPDLNTLQTQYFCLPINENLTGPTGYWDVVTDRLFKIRHCLNINGTLAPLALFSPVINPALLVRATAAGLDLGSVLNDLNSPLPLYRFTVLAQKATELTTEVKSLGALLLSVLEKKDAEALSVLRASQETKLQTAIALLKKKQIEDAQATVDLLIKQKEETTVRKDYYTGLISAGLNGWEIASLTLGGTSIALDLAIEGTYIGAAVAHAEPDGWFGAMEAVSGGPIELIKEGGSKVGASLENVARHLGTIATGFDKAAAITNTTAGYERRRQEWQFQLDLANKDLEQFDKQIANAQLRLEIAQTDADNQQLQVDQSKEAADFLASKYTNQELYNFMITQVSNTYFKSYQLAYKVAKQAEQCFRYELGLEDSAYINFGYWDSLKKGLTSGEQLFFYIKAMEVAYLDQNKREQELTKSISLSQLDPVALYKLKTNGDCWINLPEELFDIDYPGHYLRRIKSVSLTIPCIAGPYTTVSATLTMTNNSMRISPLAPADPAQYGRKMTTGSSPVPTDDPRFRDSVGALQSISTSSAQNDSGLFELNFRDERYLPFEGAGAISLWHLELPSFDTFRQIDFDSISDVIMHLKYTARDAGDPLKTSAKTSLRTKINQMLVSTRDSGLMRVFSAKNDLPTEWYRFLNPVNPTDDQVLTVNLDKTRFPLFAQNFNIKIKSIELLADNGAGSPPINGLVVTPAPSAPATISLTASAYGQNLGITMSYNNDPGTWVISNPVKNARLTGATLKNIVLIVHYTIA
ncbi:neuraminidase-like domain-containing protein [Mucilaginibacter sp. L3T2-6]|uniref:Tc toxin subunit A-related protein n=1 Tax=Mucilaginibacter sp. L3T2-6 TaxID=3062491 RepID=UPI0026772180|nr:neuraminidase-like domain-containing protein [Mucilaginibacter sp. L3T2-6]MDO3641762.1 neuraminidase-like domain-containing protein [Mucilaginibacter sp. L3T2-6]MDV6214256.1 neuraminidase-like domain-containing protein [Mucilaginibacter sp. L3T2-6]